MDYTIGSLADLITGSNTPNKPKVIQKGFVPSSKKKLNSKKVNTHNEEEVSNNSDLNDNVQLKRKKRKLINNDEDVQVTEEPKKKKKKRNNSSEETSISDIHKKKRKKQKIEESESNDFVDSDEESSVDEPKISENDINAERRVKGKDKKEKKKEKKEIDPVELSKTLFVGNIPIKISKKKIQKRFKKYGEIEAVRIRGIPVANPKIPKKTAAITKEFHPNRNSVLCYIRFKNPEDVIKAEVENGVLFEGHHLRVHSCASADKPDETKAIFVGNLSFDAEEEQLWKLFESCGPISYVRIVRDTYSGMGKGFAFVNFKESDAVQLALEMEGVKLKDRELRISLSNVSGAKKKKGFKGKKQFNRLGKPGFKKPFNKGKGQENSEPGFKKPFNKRRGQENSEPRFKKPFNKGTGQENSEQEGKPGIQKSFNKQYQGSKFTDKKKKNKVNKGLLEKKKKIKKIAPKPSLEKSN